MTRVRIEKEDASAKGWFLVRANVPDEKDRGPFDHWYATDHLPWAIKCFRLTTRLGLLEPQRSGSSLRLLRVRGCRPGQALIGSERIKPLIADFDRVWGDGVARRREVLEIVQETAP